MISKPKKIQHRKPATKKKVVKKVNKLDEAAKQFKQQMKDEKEKNQNKSNFVKAPDFHLPKEVTEFYKKNGIPDVKDAVRDYNMLEIPKGVFDLSTEVNFSKNLGNEDKKKILVMEYLLKIGYTIKNVIPSVSNKFLVLFEKEKKN